MTHRNQRWLDQTGLNLIRIVIGSYFMAISLMLVQGFDPSALFVGSVPPQTAELVGASLLFGITTAFMAGIWLRLTSLMLALFVLCSSLVQNFLHIEAASVSNFWRDITLVGAVLLSYSCLRRSDLRRAYVIGHRRPSRIRFQAGQEVMPRRVSLSSKPTTARRPASTDYSQILQTQTARPTRTHLETRDSKVWPATQSPQDRDSKDSETDEECTNIFASI